MIVISGLLVNMLDSKCSVNLWIQTRRRWNQARRSEVTFSITYFVRTVWNSMMFSSNRRRAVKCHFCKAADKLSVISWIKKSSADLETVSYNIVRLIAYKIKTIAAEQNIVLWIPYIIPCSSKPGAYIPHNATGSLTVWFQTLVCYPSSS